MTQVDRNMQESQHPTSKFCPVGIQENKSFQKQKTLFCRSTCPSPKSYVLFFFDVWDILSNNAKPAQQIYPNSWDIDRNPMRITHHLSLHAG